jgi:hypothetical protein
MLTTTHLEPLPPDRARQLADWLRRTTEDEATGLALDDAGRVVGVVPVDDPRERHLLGDLDVHA